MNPELATTPPASLTERGRQIIDRLPVSTTLLKFLVVGGFGFIIAQITLFLVYDAHILFFLPAKHTHANLLLFDDHDILLLIASILSVEMAVVCQFNFHERWTFRDRNRTGFILVRFAKYNAAASISPIIMIICVNVLTPVFRDAAGADSVIGKGAPYIANSLGVLIGFVWNYTLNSMIIWPHHRHEDAATPN